VHVGLDKQIHVDVDIIVSFVIQSRKVSKGVRSPCHVLLITLNLSIKSVSYKMVCFLFFLHEIDTYDITFSPILNQDDFFFNF